MPSYLLVDGPLDGEVLGTPEPHEAGEVLEVEVVDVAQVEVPRFRYAVETIAEFRRPGRMRHVPLAS